MKLSSCPNFISAPFISPELAGDVLAAADRELAVELAAPVVVARDEPAGAMGGVAHAVARRQPPDAAVRCRRTRRRCARRSRRRLRRLGPARRRPAGQQVVVERRAGDLVGPVRPGVEPLQRDLDVGQVPLDAVDVERRRAAGVVRPRRRSSGRSYPPVGRRASAHDTWPAWTYGASVAQVRLDGITKTFGTGADAVRAVDDVTLDIEDHEFMVLLGPSGCGKSTLLRMVAGLEDPTIGDIYIGDRRVNDVAPKARDVAMVFQSYALYPHKTVQANIEFPLKVRGVGRSERAAQAEVGRGVARPRPTPRPQARPAQRRPAPARRPGPGDRAPPGRVLHGRAAVQPRRQAARRDPRRARRAARPARQHVPVRHPRPGRGDDDGLADRGDERRSAAAGRHAGRGLRPPGHVVRRPVHRHAADEPAAGRRARRPRRRRRHPPGARPRSRPTAPTWRRCAWSSRSATRPWSPASSSGRWPAAPGWSSAWAPTRRCRRSARTSSSTCPRSIVTGSARRTGERLERRSAAT